MHSVQHPFHDTQFLIIDRDPAVLASVEGDLRMSGARIPHTAETVLLGLDILKDSHAGINCVFCAQDVTPISGLEFLKKIRGGKYGGAPAMRGVTFIMLTAHREMALVQAAVKLDVHGYITKPFDLASFTHGVHKALAHHIALKVPSAYMSIDISKANRLPVWLTPS